MEQVALVFLWLLATLFIASFSVLIGKRYGVEYPIAVMAALIVIANVLAPKIVVLGPLTVTAAILIFSSTFLLTDLIAELWGKDEARKAVWAGFYGNVAFVIAAWIAVAWQAPPFATEIAQSFNEVLGLAPRIVFASMVAYLVSQHFDIFAFQFLKRITNGKHLWLRNNASTIVSQLFDSVLFVTIAFLGVFPIFPLIISAWAAKVVIALIDTPFVYAIRALAKRV